MTAAKLAAQAITSCVEGGHAREDRAHQRRVLEEMFKSERHANVERARQRRDRDTHMSRSTVLPRIDSWIEEILGDERVVRGKRILAQLIVAADE